MNSLALDRGHALPLRWLHESLRRQRTLTLFALFMLAAMLPTLLALALDERTLRGVSVWAKPLKFMAALALFSISTAWFTGLLNPQQRGGRAARGIAAVIVVAGGFEIAYIVLQAALGQASHFNNTDLLHALLYQFMGVGAVALCLTQGVLAVQIARHGAPGADPVWRQAVLLGLALTTVLGIVSGGVLANAQPPSGHGLPLFGWHGFGDLRPAHFLGMHAQQLLPLAGLALMALARPQARRALWLFAFGYLALWLAAMAMGLHGAHLAPPRLPSS